MLKNGPETFLLISRIEIKLKCSKTAHSKELDIYIRTGPTFSLLSGLTTILRNRLQISKALIYLKYSTKSKFISTTSFTFMFFM